MQNIEEEGEGAMRKSVFLVIAIMFLCVIMVPLTTHFLEEWYAYWSHALLAIVFALATVLLKTKWYWEED